MPATNGCQLSAVPKQEQILLDRGQRAVNPRLTKVNWPLEAGPVTVNRWTPPRPGRSGDNPQTKLKVPPLLCPRPHWVVWTAMGTGKGDLERRCVRRVRDCELCRWRRACLSRVRDGELRRWRRAGLGGVRDGELSRWRCACLGRVRVCDLHSWCRAGLDRFLDGLAPLPIPRNS